MKTPDEVTAQIAPGQVSATEGLEVVTHCGLWLVTSGSFDADAVSHQTDDVEGAGRAAARRRRGRRSSQLDGIMYTEVLELDQLTFRHPVLDTSELLLSMK